MCLKHLTENNKEQPIAKKLNSKNKLKINKGPMKLTGWLRTTMDV